ncbi:MAG: 16S rRNA (uracil(1498)-N(3))-methyltransferase [Candidatus Gracilibacteria bacterium]
MPRVFVSPEHFPDIIGSDVHYLRDVLRLKPNDELELLDGSGLVHAARIETLTPDRVSCQVFSSRPSESEPRTKITLAQALPKSSKMDFIVEKCTELGVGRIIPMLTSRTIAQGVKLERWRKLAKEAAEQSGRAIIPEISDSLKLAEVLKLKDQFDLALIPWESEKENSLKSVFTVHRPSSIVFLIGPEGGFTKEEVEAARQAGFILVSLGKRIMRTETAGLATIANIIYELG